MEMTNYNNQEKNYGCNPKLMISTVSLTKIISTQEIKGK